MTKIHSLIRRLILWYWKMALQHCGANTVIDLGVNIYKPQNISLAEEVTLNAGVKLQACESATIKLGKRVVVSFNAVILTGGLALDLSARAIPRTERKHITADVVIAENVWIGANAIILPGVTVNAGAVIAAGSVVTTDVAENTLVAGVPAKFVKRVDS